MLRTIRPTSASRLPVASSSRLSSTLFTRPDPITLEQEQNAEAEAEEQTTAVSAREDLSRLLNFAADKHDLDQAKTQPRFLRHLRINSFIQPHEFHKNYSTSSSKVKSASRLNGRTTDLFWYHGIDPRNEVENRSLLSHFVTDMGRMQPRTKTGLTLKNHRLLTKAIKRSKMMGVLPVFRK